MTTRKTTFITRETHETLVVRIRPQCSTRSHLLCEQCSVPVALLTPEEAGRLAGYSAREVFHLAEAGLIHFAETPDGRLLVCPETLSQHSAAPSPQTPKL
jgi:hypothetical protein